MNFGKAIGAIFSIGFSYSNLILLCNSFSKSTLGNLTVFKLVTKSLSVLNDAAKE